MLKDLKLPSTEGIARFYQFEHGLHRGYSRGDGSTLIEYLADTIALNPRTHVPTCVRAVADAPSLQVERAVMALTPQRKEERKI